MRKLGAIFYSMCVWERLFRQEKGCGIWGLDPWWHFKLMHRGGAHKLKWKKSSFNTICVVWENTAYYFSWPAWRKIGNSSRFRDRPKCGRRYKLVFYRLTLEYFQNLRYSRRSLNSLSFSRLKLVIQEIAARHGPEKLPNFPSWRLSHVWTLTSDCY